MGNSSIARYLKKQREDREKRLEEQEKRKNNERVRRERGRFDDEDINDYKKKLEAEKKKAEAEKKKADAEKRAADDRKRQQESARRSKERDELGLTDSDLNSRDPERRRPSYTPPEEESDADRDREASRARNLQSRNIWDRPSFESPRRMYDTELTGEVSTGLSPLDTGATGLTSTRTYGQTEESDADRASSLAYGPQYQPDVRGSTRYGVGRSPLGLIDLTDTTASGLGFMADLMGKGNLDVLHPQGAGEAEANRFGLNYPSDMKPKEYVGDLRDSQYWQDLTSGVPAALEAYDYANAETDARYNGRQFGFKPELEQRNAAAGGFMANLMNIGGALVNPERSWEDVGTEAFKGMGNAFQYLTSPLTASRPTAEIARAGEKLGNTLQISTDAMAGATLRNDFSQGATAGQTFRSIAGGALDTLQQPYTGDLGALWNNFKKNAQANMDKFKAGTTPTPDQIARNTPEELKQNYFRANLNWGNADSVAKTYDALNDREKTADEYEQEANKLFHLGGAATNKSMQEQLWAQASDLRAKANELRKANAIQIVKENTNVWQQFWSEVLMPDATDFIAGSASLLKLTPMARRLTKVQGEFLQDSAKVLADLEKVPTGPLTKAAMLAQPDSRWGRFFQRFGGYTGSSRAALDAQNLTHVVATAIADAETKADVRTILTALAENPASLLTGLDASLFQSPRLINRAVDGKIRFGGMGLNNKQVLSGLNSYRNVAAELIANSPSLIGEGPINKLDFFFKDFIPGVEQGGYRRYKVATELGQAPVGTVEAKASTLANGAVVEYYNEAGDLIGRKNVSNINLANREVRAIATKKRLARTNVLKAIGDFERGLVSPLYITLSPQTWATNLLGAIGVSIGDNNFAWKTRSEMDSLMEKLYGGVWGNKRSIEKGGESTIGASQIGGELDWLPGNPAGGKTPYSWIPGVGKGLDKLGETYGNLDEFSGARNVYHSTMRGIDEMLPAELKKFRNTLIQNGMDPDDAKRVTGAMHEAGRAGEDMFKTLNDFMSGKQKAFSLGDINKNWVEVLSAGSVQQMSDFKRALLNAKDPTEYRSIVNQYVDQARKQWENQLGEAAPPLQRYSWQQNENLKDNAEIRALADNMKKRGSTPEEAEAFFQEQVTARKALEEKQSVVQDLVVKSGDPDNSKLLYDLWMDAKLATDKVRQQAAELAQRTRDATAGMNLATASPIWQQQYFQPIRQLWDERNKVVNELYDNALQAVQSGEKYTPVDNYWQRLERSTVGDTADLEKTLATEVGSSRTDPRFGNVVAAGQALTDREVARTFAYANQFPNSPHIFDYLVSGERANQIAGAQASHAVDILFDLLQEKKITNAEFFKQRNQVWRDLRQYERNIQVWVRQSIRNDARGVFTDGEKVLDRTGRQFTIQGRHPLTSRDGVPYYRVAEQKELVPADDLFRAGEEAIVEPPRPTIFNSQEKPLTDNELFALAEESGIPTTNKAGHPMNKAILNVINKELENRGLPKVRALNELDDIGRRAAEDALVRRATQVTGDYNPLGMNLNPNARTVDELVDNANLTSRNTTAIGGGTHNVDDIGLAAQHALDQLEDMRKWLLNHAGEVANTKPGIYSPQQTVNILNSYRKQMAPAWDTIKAAAAEYANRARGFSVLDSTGRTQLDNLIGTMVPYSFFWTRSIKNMMERMIFEPHIYRRVAQYNDAMNQSREQEGEPDRFQNNLRVQMPDGSVYYLNLNPMKYWPTLQSLFYSDFADPEEANTSFGKAFESAQSTNASFFPWIDAGVKVADGRPEEIYPMSYAGPLGNIISWASPYVTGYDYSNPIARAFKPQWLEHNTARELMLMVEDGSLDYETALQAYQILRTQRTGDKIPEQANYDMEKLTPILDDAAVRAANKQETAAISGGLTSVAIKPYDTGETEANKQVDEFFNRQYDPVENPYGYNPRPSPLAQVRLSQYGVSDEDKTQPGVSLSTSQYIESKDKVTEALNAAAARAVDPVAEANGSSKEMNDAKIKAALEAAKQYVDPVKVDAYARSIENDDGYAQGISVGDIIYWTNNQIKTTQFPSAFEFMPSESKLPEVDERTAMHGSAERLGAEPGLGKSTYGTNQEMNQYQAEENAITEVLQYGQFLRNQYGPTIPDKGTTDASKAARNEAFDALEDHQAQIDEMTKKRLMEMGFTEAEATEAIKNYQERFMSDKEIERREELDIISQGYDDLRACKKGDYECRKRVFANNPLLAEEHKKRYGEDSLDYLYGPKNKEFAAAQNWVYQNKPEYKDLWDQYYDLPKGEARERFVDEHPEMTLLNFAAYNPKEYEASKEYFTDEDIIAWGGRPDDPDKRRDYFDENPNAFLVHSWMYGRPVNFDENKGEGEWESDYGADYAEARNLFGDGIWDVVSQYKRGWDKAQKRAFFTEHPEYREWANWWYGNDEEGKKYTGSRSGAGYDSLGHRAYGSYGGGGGGGGGYSSGGGIPYRFDFFQPRGGSVWSSNWSREPEEWSYRPPQDFSGDWKRLIQTPLPRI